MSPTVRRSSAEPTPPRAEIDARGQLPAPLSANELDRYAELIVNGCISLAPNDTLLLLANLGHRPLTAALARAAYRNGALAVDAVYQDNELQAAKVELAAAAAIGEQPPWTKAQWQALGREEVAFVEVRSDFELDILAGLPAERLAADAATRAQSLSRLRRERRLRGTICTWPTAEWAAKVFPAHPTAQAQQQLARELLHFCRIGPDDPPGYRGWSEHLAALRHRAETLTKLNLKEVEIRDTGTALRLGIATHSCWAGGGERDCWGRRIAMNVPTEECFISPDAAAVEGTFRCSRPRTIAGRLIEGLAGEFRAGRLVRLKARRERDRDWLASYLAAVPNADRLGEVALVDGSSRIGRTGRTYYNSLLDENAAAHIALGAGLAKTRTLPVGRVRYGLNRCDIHIDVMVGTDALEAVGIAHTGRRVPLVSDGSWQV